MRVTDAATLQRLEGEFAKLPAAYVADGHHRTASAARVALELRGKGEGSVDSDWFLCVLFPGNQLQIMPYNRTVKDLNGLTNPEFLAKVEEVCTRMHFVVQEFEDLEPFAKRASEYEVDPQLQKLAEDVAITGGVLFGNMHTFQHDDA